MGSQALSQEYIVEKKILYRQNIDEWEMLLKIWISVFVYMYVYVYVGKWVCIWTPYWGNMLYIYVWINSLSVVTAAVNKIAASYNINIYLPIFFVCIHILMYVYIIFQTPPLNSQKCTNLMPLLNLCTPKAP